jgi:sialate O-acetylesterase
MTIKGVIWYQGESNVVRAYQYRKLFPAMIKNWRCDFNNFQMPFYFVQLASFVKHSPGKDVEIYKGEPRELAWAEMMEAQFMTNDLKNTGMAVTIDIGEPNNIHPGNKRDVGKRLALWALAKNYGKDIECSDPFYAGYRVEGDKIRVFFSHADSGLMGKGNRLKGFAIAGKNRKFVWADARIDGRIVLVSSLDIKEPIAVRYAWDGYPECNLFNTIGLPASPFKTDDWKGITYNSK